MGPETWSPPTGRPMRAPAPRRGRTGLAHALRCAVLACLGLSGLSGLTQAGASSLGDSWQEPSARGAGQGPQEDLELSATPGKDTLLEFAVPCRTAPPGGACSGGTVVAQFTSRPTQFITGAWNAQGVQCVYEASYVACPMSPTRDGAVQRLHMMLHVEPQEYSSNAGVLEGRDGFQMDRVRFLVRMRGEATLELQAPKEVIVPSDSSVEVTKLGLRNAGPSVTHGVNVRIGPFPDDLVPYVAADEPNCKVHGPVVDCTPPDLAPGVPQELRMLILPDPSRLPPLPVHHEIDVTATSDQAQSQARFLVSVPAPPRPQ